MADTRDTPVLTPVLADENSLHDEKSIDKDKAFVSHGEVQPAGYPTDEERHTLRRIPGKVPWTAYLIALLELAERYSYYGTTVVFTNFIQQALPVGSITGAGGPTGVRSGALGLGQPTSFALGTFNSFWVYICPLFGAYIADTYLGRYKTLCYALGIAILGHILLIIAAIPSVIVNPMGALGCFVIAIIIMGMGTGAFKSSVSPLVAEQMTQQTLIVDTLPTGERVIIDPALTASRIYMYFYMMINIGALVGQIGMVYAANEVGFWLAFTLPTIVLMLCPIVLWVGNNRYVKTPPSGSVLSKSMRLFRHAAHGRWTSPKLLTAPDFWEAAKPSKIAPEMRPSWMTFDDAWVDEVRRGFKACTVFAWYPLYWLTYNQINNNLTSQAAVMNTNGLPNDILSNLNPLSLVIFIPIFDLVIYPFLARLNIKFTPIKKITLGFATASCAMIWAAVVQAYIYKLSVCGNYAATCEEQPFVDLNVWAQTGSYVLIGISEILASITGLEYAFTKAPKSMRSLVMSVYLFQTAFSSAIGFAFIPLSGDPLLVWNYGVMAVLAATASVGFWFSFRHLDKAEVGLNDLVAGHVVKDFKE